VPESHYRIVGPLTINRMSRAVSCFGEPVALTTREFELLDYVAGQEGQVVSREALVREVWKESQRTATLNNVIDVHIARLRRKIERPDAVRLIHTIRGVGFMLRYGEP
jgi:two-component system copper resistance phosphate regulon response regulator CusR